MVYFQDRPGAQPVKISLDEAAVIDLDAPVLSAYARRIDGAVRWCV